MFERFTDRARRVVVLAQQEARLLNHTYIGTEHLLLGILAIGEGAAVRALDEMGITLEIVRRQVVRIVGLGQLEHRPSGHIPFTPRAKKVFELSLREALQLGHNYIGTEHLLLGLIREGNGVAAQILGQLGGDLSVVRMNVVRLTALAGEEPEAADVATPSRSLAGPRGILAMLEDISARLERIEEHLGIVRTPRAGTLAAAEGAARAEVGSRSAVGESAGDSGAAESAGAGGSLSDTATESESLRAEESQPDTATESESLRAEESQSDTATESESLRAEESQSDTAAESES